MEKKTIRRFAAGVLLVPGLFLAFASQSAAEKNYYVPDSSISIDGKVDDWGDAIITDKEDVDQILYCWNEDTFDWDEIGEADECSTWLYSEMGQVDVTNGWFGMNEENLIFALQTSFPMYSFVNADDGSVVNLLKTNQVAETGIDHLPDYSTFSQDMVLAFDVDPKNGTESYDWYLVANIDYDLLPQEEEEQDNGDSMDDEEESTAFLQIYQENGDTLGFQSDEDTFVAEIDPSQSEVSLDRPKSVTEAIEIRQEISSFYDVTGIDVGDEVMIRLESLAQAGEKTKPVLVVFQNEPIESLPEPPTKLSVSDVKTNKADLAWRKPVGKQKVIRYQVDFRERGEANRDEWRVAKYVKKTNMTIRKLQKNTRYQFRVAACNDAGCSESSSWFSFRTAKK